jgi:hypothetical protein
MADAVTKICRWETELNGNICTNLHSKYCSEECTIDKQKKCNKFEKGKRIKQEFSYLCEEDEECEEN